MNIHVMIMKTRSSSEWPIINKSGVDTAKRCNVTQPLHGAYYYYAVRTHRNATQDNNYIRRNECYIMERSV